MHGPIPVPPPPAVLRPSLTPPPRRLLSGAALAPIPSKPARECLECGGDIPATAQGTAEFCCRTCQKTWGNRRMQRGAQLYDMVMILRFDRRAAKARGIWSLLCAVASAFRDADNARRAGRRSWRKPQQVIDSIPNAYGREGDKR